MSTVVPRPRALAPAAEVQEAVVTARDVRRAHGRSLVLSVVVPAAGALVLRSVAGAGRWVSEPVHSTLETAGGLVALLVAALLLRRRRTFVEEPHYAWVAVALTCMGVLDLAHACTPQGPAFFWSRTIPTLLGGAALGLVWIRPGRQAQRVADVGLGVALAIAVLLSAALLLLPGAWPLMFSPAGYTAGAKLLTVVSAVGFFAAAPFFLRRHRQVGSREDLVLANLCLLFGVAALLFSISHMWGAVWWLFHVLRLVAFLVVLAHVFALYRRFQSHQGALEARLEFQQLMLGTVGHDMRTPIAAMKMTVDALRRRLEAGSPERAALERLDRSASRLEGLVSGLLDFARARTGEGIPVELARTALDEVLARVVDEVGAAHPATAVRCSVSGDAAGTWDAGRLAQLATNLVENAVRHAPAGSAVDVTVDGTRPDEVLLCVHNGGEPIPRELLPRVFEPFQRAAAGERRGLGLGLFIVREIARAHGGHVSVASTAEGGTSFRVRLPREPGGR